MPFPKPLLGSPGTVELAEVRMLKLEASRIMIDLRHRQYFRLAEKMANKTHAGRMVSSSETIRLNDAGIPDQLSSSATAR